MCVAALEFVRVTPDGTGIVLRDAAGNESTVPMDERLLSALMPRELSAVDDQHHLSPREIQARVRAGADPRALAEQAGMPLSKVMSFAQPILQERAHVAVRARATTVRRASGAGTIDDIVTTRLQPLGVSDLDLTWDARRLDDGRWQVRLSYDTAEGARLATWLFDMRAAVISPVDDEAHWLMGEPVAPVSRTQATVTRPTLPVFLNTEEKGSTETNNVYSLHRNREAVEDLIDVVDALDDATDFEDASIDEVFAADTTTDVADVEPAPAADEPMEDISTPPAEPDSVTEEPAADTPMRRGNRRGRKSIPSWDEILFGPNGDE